MPTVLVAKDTTSKAEGTGKCDGIAALSREGAKLLADLEDARMAALRLAKQTRHAADDLLEGATHGIKRHPLPALGIAFGAGAALGMILVGSFKVGKT